MSQIQKTIPLRTDTEVTQDETVAVDHSRQQVCFALTIKGEGKSNLVEAEGAIEFELGYLLMDFHSPLSGNMENGFWCIPKLKDDDEILAFRKNPIPFLRKRKAYKVTFIASESITFTKARLDRYNDRIYTKKDMRRKGFFEYNSRSPPMKPEKDWGKEMIRVVKIPTISSHGTTDNDKEAVEIVTREMLACRDERRILVLNRKMIFSEKQYFWVLEMMIRNLSRFYDLHCPKKYPAEFGVKTREEMLPRDRNWHRMCVITREMGELAPSKFKADKSGESTTVKRALLELARTTRHAGIDWFGDWQRRNDVASEIRDQCDTWFFKKYNLGLGGMDTIRFFEVLQSCREQILGAVRNKKRANLIIKSIYPNINKLSKKYFYAYFLSEKIKLFRVPENKHQHKEEDMKFHEMTGIWFDHDKKLVPVSAQGGGGKMGVTEQRALYDAVQALRSRTGRNKLTWEGVRKELVKLQKQKQLSYRQNFEEKNSDWICATFAKLKKKFAEASSIPVIN